MMCLTVVPIPEDSRVIFFCYTVQIENSCVCTNNRPIASSPDLPLNPLPKTNMGIERMPGDEANRPVINASCLLFSHDDHL